MTNSNREEELLIAERAAEWLARLNTAGPQERSAFLEWLKESRQHVREVLLATTWDTLLTHVDPDHRVDLQQLITKSSANVVPVRPGDFVVRVTDAQPRRWARWPWLAGFGAVAAALALLVFGWSGIAMNFHPKQFATAIGEQRAFELADGSVIHLNTQSRVRVDFSEEARDVHLHEGQVIFKVKHDPARPFRVHVGQAVIQAIGTQFDVYRRADRTNVAIIEGSVQITPEAPSDSNTIALAQLPERIRIAAGESVSIVADGQITPPAPIDVVEVNAWQQRRLIFRRHTLEEIAAEFNRYNRTLQIRVEGDVLQARRFSGVFDADDPESLLTYLASDSGLVFDRQGSELVIRLRSDTELAVHAI